MKRTLIVAAAFTLFMPIAAQAQGVVEGAREGSRAGNKAAGPVGGAVGGAAGAVVGGVAGGVKGVLGVPQKTTKKRKTKSQ